MLPLMLPGGSLALIGSSAEALWGLCSSAVPAPRSCLLHLSCSQRYALNSRSRLGSASPYLGSPSPFNSLATTGFTSFVSYFSRVTVFHCLTSKVLKTTVSHNLSGILVTSGWRVNLLPVSLYWLEAEVYLTGLRLQISCPSDDSCCMWIVPTTYMDCARYLINVTCILT